ncbi:MAG: HNH endonuclease signature motif containing protein [Nanoarchaeota archaeon]|nr:HNH endonuclease signature motif containing protein [Nanoarchaeota archaeon]
MIKKCINCNEEKEHHAKGLCYTCYKKLKWQPKIKKCKRCGREMAIHAKEFCGGCYNLIFHLEKNKAYNHRKSQNVDLKTYRRLTQRCVICDFDKIVDIHHIDLNKKNNSPKNLIGLCPNHHRLIHNFNFRPEIFKILKEKGFSLPLEFTKNTAMNHF